MEPAPVIRSFAALMNEDTEVAEAFLLAAVYAVALHDDTTPRDVADRLFKAMPSAATWPTLRASLLWLLDNEDGAGEETP